MRPSLHPHLVNGRFGDPALFVEVLHRRDALLFDMGDLGALSARDLLRVGHVFVSHMHMDHFIGFDALLRVNVGREKRIRVAGPQGLCERLHHKLQGYEWDLADRYDADLVFEATELGDDGPLRSARFSFKESFAWSEMPNPWWPLDAGQGLAVRHALLEHHGPCIGYAAAEQAHANVWPNRVRELGLEPGPWLKQLKQAVLAGAADDETIALPEGRSVALRELRPLVSVSRGQKIAYVTDVADTPANRRAIAELAHGADTFFIESRFAAEDRAQAEQRAHLTTRAAGEIGQAAGVRKLEPFHFSPRYEGEEASMLREVAAAFAGEPLPPSRVGQGRGDGDMMDGNEGRDSDGAGTQGMVEEKGPSASQPGSAEGAGGGSDTDGAGTLGMVAENSRVQQAGEGGTTRFGMEGDDTDGAGTRGMAHEDAADGSDAEDAG